MLGGGVGLEMHVHEDGSGRLVPVLQLLRGSYCTPLEFGTAERQTPENSLEDRVECMQHFDW